MLLKSISEMITCLSIDKALFAVSLKMDYCAIFEENISDVLW